MDDAINVTVQTTEEEENENGEEKSEQLLFSLPSFPLVPIWTNP